MHTCNGEVANILVKKGFRGRVANLGLGVDVERFRPAKGTEPGDGTGPLRIGYVGRIEERKGVFTLLAALGEVPDASLTYVGGGPDLARLEAAIEARHLSDRAIVRGFADHDDLPGVYRGFDVVVIPSLSQPGWVEQFGRVAAEAMACGVPVVVSDCGALPEVVADAGVIVPEGNASALAEALRHLAACPEQRAALRGRGLRARTALLVAGGRAPTGRRLRQPLRQRNCPKAV